jgi:uncharacterized membrane protein
MPDWRVLVAIGALGIVSYAMRAGGYLAAGAFRDEGAVARFFRLAPGNLFVAFVTAGCLEGGWPSLAGCACALTTMVVTRREWAALGVGFGAAAATSALLSGRSLLWG